VWSDGSNDGESTYGIALIVIANVAEKSSTIYRNIYTYTAVKKNIKNYSRLGSVAEFDAFRLEKLNKIYFFLEGSFLCFHLRA